MYHRMALLAEVVQKHVGVGVPDKETRVVTVVV